MAGSGLSLDRGSVGAGAGRRAALSRTWPTDPVQWAHAGRRRPNHQEAHHAPQAQHLLQLCADQPGQQPGWPPADCHRLDRLQPAQWQAQCGPEARHRRLHLGVPARRPEPRARPVCSTPRPRDPSHPAASVGPGPAVAPSGACISSPRVKWGLRQPHVTCPVLPMGAVTTRGHVSALPAFPDMPV